jgi:hypothetical protein
MPQAKRAHANFEENAAVRLFRAAKFGAAGIGAHNSPLPRPDPQKWSVCSPFQLRARCLLAEPTAPALAGRFFLAKDQRPTTEDLLKNVEVASRPGLFPPGKEAKSEVKGAKKTSKGATKNSKTATVLRQGGHGKSQGGHAKSAGEMTNECVVWKISSRADAPGRRGRRRSPYTAPSRHSILKNVKVASRPRPLPPGKMIKSEGKVIIEMGKMIMKNCKVIMVLGQGAHEKRQGAQT